ncbi:sirohydrochlorin ferrochelatase [Herbihabitans rhizosphaerae]|uniref:Sirohydrochlorin ferrochelatase n=1 Tax=Herbihabitans rhizosphaerae TaxID=1872711 RepID=A0A4Q7KLS2_9PSEU|nr:sirohydrochlorin chelatase [Herbihabitans rhizosphaerae]RZS34906.1 sirohydrochlorin ferrochelatase [Herbihabitans rhizosphaerae]
MGTLVLVAHGTRDPAGASTVDSITDAVRHRLRGVTVRVAYADVRAPDVTAVLREVPGPAVVVPMFLARGYHVRADVPAQLVAAGRSSGDTRLTDAIGTDRRLVAAAHDRLLAAGARPGDAVVFAAAGSSDEGALADVRLAAAGLAARTGADVRIAYAATATPKVADVVSELRARRQRVAVASWLLAPGQFQRVVAASGADLVADPLGAHPAVVDAVVSRYAGGHAPLALAGTHAHPCISR